MDDDNNDQGLAREKHISARIVSSSDVVSSMPIADLQSQRYLNDHASIFHPVSHRRVSRPSNNQPTCFKTLIPNL